MKNLKTPEECVEFSGVLRVSILGRFLSGSGSVKRLEFVFGVTKGRSARALDKPTLSVR